MDLKMINEKLTGLFAKHRIVFWNDVSGRFEKDLVECLPQGVEILRPDKIGQLKAKVIIEIENPQNKFLVYSALPEPGAEEDWLLDIRLYSHQFHADTSSMLVEELGLQLHQLREHISKRLKFFENKQSLTKIKSMISPSDLEKDIDRKMLAVIVKAENDRFFNIINAIFTAFPFDEGLDAIPDVFDTVQKMDMEDVFWSFAQDVFGYKEEKHSLRHLLTCLFISDLYISLGDQLCQNVRQFVLPGGFARDAAVFMSEWRDSVKMAESYDRLSGMVADAVGIERYLSEIPLTTPENISAIKHVVTFAAIEGICASAMKVYVLDHEPTIDKDFVASFCRHRQALHWSNKRPGSETDTRGSFWAVYESLIAAAEFMAKKKNYPQGFMYTSAKVILEAYTCDLYLFDRYYRIFYEHAGIADAQGWDILKNLKIRMEDLYNNWFLVPLTLLWEENINLNGWRIDNVVNQYDFFGKYPEPKAGDKNAAVFVVISDALRYEAGAEIADVLNGKFRIAATKEAVLGCVPSYTGLGMAALLPHSKLSYTSKADVLVDGKACSDTKQRNEILSAHKCMGIKGNELVRKTRDDAREMVRGKNVIYLYHNTIDAIGDDPKTEEKTFKAVRDAIIEVSNIVSFVVNNLNARYVYITADHGFIYTDSHPVEIDRNKGILSDKSFAVLNKRYSLGRNISDLDYVHRGTVSNTAGVTPDEDMQFAVPKGMSLYYFTGGARFFHGGVSLQEVVIPVITVEHIRGKEKEKTRDRVVGVQVLGQDHRITTAKHRFEILQIDAVSDRVKAVTFKIGIYANKEPVSDIQSVTFESTSQEMSERKREVVLTLKNVSFTGSKEYWLILRNADTDIEGQSIPVRMDRLFTSDF